MHADLQAEFEAALRGAAVPAQVTAREPDEVARRFAVYRNNVAVSLTEALRQRFPVIERLVGSDFFRAMALHYAGENRPETPVLAEWGQGFPDFLASFPPLAAFPYMADVARIEYARGRAFHAADRAAIDPQAFLGADPISLRLALHPSVLLLHLSCPAVSIWARNQPAARHDANEPLPDAAETALILRDLTFDVQVFSVGAGDAALIGALLRRETLAEAALAAQMAQPGHDPQAMLVHLMRAGAITDGKEDTCVRP
jgi:hypothetical protein